MIKQGAHSPTHLLLAVGKPGELIIIIIIILNFNLLLILMVGSLEQGAGRPLLLHHSLASPLSDRTRHTQNTATNTQSFPYCKGFLDFTPYITNNTHLTKYT